MLSQVSPGRKNHQSLELSGSQSSLRWCAEEPELLWIGYRDQPNQLLLRGAVPGAPVSTSGDYPAGHGQGFPDTFKALFREVYQAVAVGDSTAPANYPTFDDGVEQANVTDAIAASARSGTWSLDERAPLAP